jgi:uncharacterized protein YjbI with pentapeptide repeats
MADHSHLDILKEGVEAWNEWRTQNPSITPDLSASNLLMADLSGANLSQANLSGAMLAQADITRANFSEANLSSADLSAVILSGETTFTRANLSGADLSAATGLTQLQIDQANGDEKTQLPEGLKRPAAWSQP